MRSHNELMYEREMRQKEREIKQFNEQLKSSPHLLDNELYLFQNMSRTRLKLKQLPIKHLDNILLITEYFKQRRESSNFKHIKPVILNNPIFLANAINHNPELYFLISDENKSIFKATAISKDKDYLKYLSKEDYDNPDILHKITFGLKDFQESLNCITPEILKTLLTGKNGSYVDEAILKLDINQCHYMKVALNSYIEENKVKKGNFWFENILNKNPYLYITLDKEQYKDEKSKELILSITGKYHDVFTYLPKEWKKDIEVITRIISDQSETSYTYQNHGMTYHANIKNVALILNEYDFPEKFLLEKMDQINMKFIRAAYIYLTEDWRNEPIIIKSLFKERDKFEVDLNYCRSIPNEELAESLVNHLKNCKVRTLSEVGETLEKVVAYHYMKEKLVPKNTSEKKLKI